MDWSRAKNVLILSFLFLNIVLGFQLWTSKSKQTELTADTSGGVEELNRALHSKNIRLAVEVPRDVPRLREITVKFDESLRSEEKISLKKPLPITKILAKGSGKQAQARLEIPRMDLYQFDAVTSNNGVYMLNQMFGLLPMFEVKLELYEENGEITSYRQAYVEVESGGEQKDQKVIPAHIAISSLAENYLIEGSVITDVRLGYHGQLYNSQTQYMVPSWRVSVDNGDIYYVQAFSGAVEVPQKDTNDMSKGAAED